VGGNSRGRCEASIGGDPLSDLPQMTEDQYWAAVRRLGLRPSNVPFVYLDRDNEAHNAPDPKNMTMEQRAETIERIKRNLGIGTAQ